MQQVQAPYPDIKIKGYEAGVADSPYLGFAEMRNVDVVTRPGAVMLTPKLANTISASVTGAFTADAGTDVLTGPDLAYSIFGTDYFGYRAVTVSNSGGALPSPLAAATVYYATSVSATTYKLSTTLANAVAGTYINIADAGTGTHTLATIDPSYFTCYDYDSSGSKLYGLDSNGRLWQQNSLLWYLITGNTLPSAGQGGQGYRIFKGYHFVFRANAIDVAAITDSPSWSNSWQGLNSGGGVHPSIVTMDQILYFGDRDNLNNPYIGMVTFTNSGSPPFSANTSKLAIPKYKFINCLEELGVNLMIGTTGKETYPWNRSDTVLSSNPIMCAEKNITALRNINNQIYAAAGTKGNIYKYNGYLMEPFKIFPKHLLATESSAATIGDIATLGRKLLFTLQTKGNSGVWSVDLYTKALVMENTVSSGSVGTSNPLVLPALYSDGISYWASWSDVDAGTYGVDTSTNNGPFVYPTDGSAYITTQNYDIAILVDGQAAIKRVMQFIEAFFDRPLVTGCSLVIYARTSQSAAWGNALCTLTGDDASQYFLKNANTINGTDVQFKIVIIGTSGVTPYLQEMRAN